VRVIHLAHSYTAQELSEMVKEVRSLQSMPYIYPMLTPPTVVTRGTAGEVDVAERLIHERDVLAAR
jgi:hypothetical protein